MGTQYDKFKQKASAKAKQNRINRVTKKANKYNNGKLNKTHKNYVAGDILSSASTRAYGYKKYGIQGDSYITEKGRSRANQAKINRGENPYELKYIYDGISRNVKGGTRADGSKYDSFKSKKRFLTDDEKKAWNATGSINVNKYNKSHKYSILSGRDSDGKTFQSNLNWRDKSGKMKWDGMEVAKNKVKSGGSKLNYIGGFLKDTVLDPGIDLMKSVDYLESGLMGGALGLGETVNDVSKALTGQKKFSDVNYKRAIDNFKESTNESNKTGWGKSSIDYFKDWSKRNDEDRYQHLLKTKGKESADSFKKTNEKLKPVTDVASTVLGFGADLLNPFEVGSAITKTTKKLAGESIDLAKNIKRGTADVSLGFTPDKGRTQEALERFAKQRKAKVHKSDGNALESLITSPEERLTMNDNKRVFKLNNSLNKSYDVAMAKKEVKKVVASNPQTQNLSKFLDEMPLKGTQIKIDGRTLNKKYTQTKDKYIPQLFRNGEQIVDEVGTVDKNQLSMFNRNGNTNTYQKNLKLDKNRFEKMYNAYYDEDMFFEMIDDLSDSNADGMLDWLQKNKPDVYKRYMGDIDDVDNIVDKDIKQQEFKDTINEKVENQNEHDYFTTEDVRELNPYINKYVNPEEVMNYTPGINDFDIEDYLDLNPFEPKEVAERKPSRFKVKTSDVTKTIATELANFTHNDNTVIRNAYNRMNIDRIMNKLDRPQVADDIKDINKRKETFSRSGNVFSLNLEYLSNEELVELQNAFRYFDDMELDDYDKRDLAVDMLNKMMFGNKNIIRRNIPVDKLKGLLTYFDDLAESKIALYNGEYSFKPRGEYNTSKNGIHYFTGKNGKPNPFDEKFNFFAPTSVDDVFEEKMKGIGKKLGVSSKSKELDEPFKVLTDKIKSGEKLSKDELEQYKTIKHKLDSWNKHWQNVKNMGYDDYDKYYDENLFKKSKLDDFSILEDNSLKLSSETEFKGFDTPDRISEIEKKYRNKYQSNQIENSIDALFEKRPYESVLGNGYDYAGMLDEDDYQRMLYEENHAIDVIGDLGLKFVNYDKFNLPKDKKLTYRELARHKEVKKALINIRKLTDKMLGTPVEMETTHKILRTEMRRISDSLKKAGVDNDVWLEELTKYKNSKLKSIKTNAESPLELAGLNIKSSKKYNDGYLSPLDREYKKLKSQGAKTWDELYSDDYYKSVFDDKYANSDGIFKDKSLRGDNTGDNITSNNPLEKLRRKGSGSRASRLEPWQTINDAPENSIENMRKRSKEYVDNTVTSDKAIDYDAFVDESNNELGDFWNKINSQNENLSYLRPEVQELIRNGKSIKKSNPNISKNLDDIYYRNSYKLNNGEIPKPSAKLFEDGRMLDYTTGEMRPVTKNAKAQNFELKQSHKYSARNYDEDVQIAKFMQNIEKRNIYDYFAMFDRMNIKFDPSNEKSIEKAFSKFDWIINKKQKEGRLDLNRLATNRAIDTVKRKDLELANKGINPNVDRTTDSFKQMGEVLNKHQYSHQVESDFEKLTKDLVEKQKLDEVGSIYKQDVIDKANERKIENAIKRADELEKPYIEKEQANKKYYEMIDGFIQNNKRMDQYELYKNLFQQLDNIEDGNTSLNYLDELINYLNNDKGLDQMYKNRFVNQAKQEMLKLANKGIDPYVDTRFKAFKELHNSMNQQIYSPQINADVDMANAINDDMKKILEYESNRKPNQTILDKMSNKGSKPSLLEEVKSNKKSKEEMRKVRRQKNTLNNLRSERSDDVQEIINKNKILEGSKKIANRSDVLEQISKGEKPKPVLKTKDELIKDFSVDEKVVEKLNSGELSIDELATAIDDDIAQFEKDNSKKAHFKEWFNDGDNIGYDNNNELYNGYKRWLNSWKKGLTVYNPGWHIQNFFQNKGQNYLALGADAFGSQKDARELLKNINGETNKAKDVISKSGKVYTPKEIADLAKQYDVIDGWGDFETQSKGIFPKLETKIDNSRLMKKLGKNEETARLYHFITKLERGSTPEEASKSVNKYLFDYSKRNKADRVMSDFIDPFWTFHKNNARMLTQAMYENPSRSANILRANRGLNNSVKDEDKSSSQHREHQSPFGSFKDSVNGDMYHYQYDETVLPDVQDAIPLEKDDILNKLNPLLNIAYKQNQGVGNFDKKVVDGEAGWNEISKDERIGEIARDLNPLMNPLVKAYYKAKSHQEKADKGKQSQDTSDKQILMDWIAYITGNKGNYYRDWK